jgi:hypothetical protein
MKKKKDREQAKKKFEEEKTIEWQSKTSKW